MGVSSILDIARSALTAQQTALEVVSHNVANTNTEGYSRQRLTLETQDPCPLGGMLLGRGVRMEGIERAYNLFMELNINTKASSLASLEAQKSYMGMVESIFDEMSDQGLSSLLSQFWNGWHDLVNNPAGLAERQALTERAELLGEGLRSANADLERLRVNLRGQILTTVEEINRLAAEIAEINNQIVGFEAGGKVANDLRDQRGLLLRQLAEYVGNNFFESEDGSVTVLIGKGHSLVIGSSCHRLEGSLTGTGTMAISIAGAGTSTNITNSLGQEGKLGGYLTIYNSDLANYQQDLDTFAAGLIREVNRQHSQGCGVEFFTSLTSDYAVDDPDAALASAASELPFYSEIDDSGTASFKVWVYDANGDVVTPGGTTITISAGMTLNQLAAAIDATTGISASVAGGRLTITAGGGNTFGLAEDNSNVLMATGLNTFFSGSDAASIALAAHITANPMQIAAGQIDASGSHGPGDGRNALLIAELAEGSYDLGGVQKSFADFLNSLVGQIGIHSAGLQRSHAFSESLLSQLVKTRDAHTSVSLDEEMTNLIKFQHAYEAAAKLVKVADEMLVSLLEMK